MEDVADVAGSSGANVAIVIHGAWQNPIGGGTISSGPHLFFGVIDAGPTGFTEVQFREVGGKVGQALFIFGDEFTLLAEPPARLPALDGRGIVVWYCCFSWPASRHSPV